MLGERLPADEGAMEELDGFAREPRLALCEPLDVLPSSREHPHEPLLVGGRERMTRS